MTTTSKDEDQKVIDLAIEQLSDSFGYDLNPEDFEDDEFFFRTEEEVKEVMMEWLDSPGSYGYMAKELFTYFDDKQYEIEDCQLYDLDWGSVAKVGDGRYLFCSNSWSDSGLFLNQ